jgi:hypothetical protein
MGDMTLRRGGFVRSMKARHFVGSRRTGVGGIRFMQLVRHSTASARCDSTARARTNRLLRRRLFILAAVQFFDIEIWGAPRRGLAWSETEPGIGGLRMHPRAGVSLARRPGWENVPCVAQPDEDAPHRVAAANHRQRQHAHLEPVPVPADEPLGLRPGHGHAPVVGPRLPQHRRARLRRRPQIDRAEVDPEAFLVPPGGRGADRNGRRRRVGQHGHLELGGDARRPLDVECARRPVKRRLVFVRVDKDLWINGFNGSGVRYGSKCASPGHKW